jgi:hypothetical protein
MRALGTYSIETEPTEPYPQQVRVGEAAAVEQQRVPRAHVPQHVQEAHLRGLEVLTGYVRGTLGYSRPRTHLAQHDPAVLHVPRDKLGLARAREVAVQLQQLRDDP